MSAVLFTVLLWPWDNPACVILRTGGALGMGPPGGDPNIYGCWAWAFGRDEQPEEGGVLLPYNPNTTGIPVGRRSTLVSDTSLVICPIPGVGGGLLFLGRLLRRVRISLLPFSVVNFHFPIFGVGLRFSLWVIITFIGRQSRALQYKKEYFGDNTLSIGWVIMSLLIERISRTARAVTLGARISVNIIMGGILHSVVGERIRRWGILGLSVLESIVVVIQVYVFVLLLCLYTAELE